MPEQGSGNMGAKVSNPPAAWKRVAALVYDANAPVVLQALDLSAYVGVARAMVFLKIAEIGGANNTYTFLSGDDVAENPYYPGWNKFLLAADTMANVILETNSAGIIYWGSDTVAIHTHITLLSYMRIL